ncbi:MAG: thioredoxin family protein, partial [Armatimonadota bacterium]
MSDPTLDPAALDPLKDAVQRGGEPRSLVLHVQRERSEFQDRLRDLARQVNEGTGGAVAIEERSAARAPGDDAGTPVGETGHPPAAPALTVRLGERDVVHYLALPEGPEQAPFLELLAAPASVAVASDRANQLSALEQPTEILVFIAAACPNCPLGVRAANALALASPRVTVSVVDGFRFEAFASRFHVKSVPTTVVNRGLTLIGVKTMEELVWHIQQLQGPEATPAIFASLVEAGRFSDAAAQLV